MRIYAISANDVAFQRRSKKRNDEKREAQTFHEQSFQTFINNYCKSLNFFQSYCIIQ